MTAIVGVSAHTTDATVITRIAAISGRRRPRWSETGPPTSCPSAMPTKNVVNVSWTCVAVAANSPATCGNAGTYMSVASGAIAVRNTTVATRPAVRVGLGMPGECMATPRIGGISSYRSGSRASGSLTPGNPVGDLSRSLQRDVYRQGIPSGPEPVVASMTWTTVPRSASS
jgi:hypothetical protein